MRVFEAHGVYSTQCYSTQLCGTTAGTGAADGVWLEKKNYLDLTNLQMAFLQGSGAEAPERLARVGSWGFGGAPAPLPTGGAVPGRECSPGGFRCDTHRSWAGNREMYI